MPEKIVPPKDRSIGIYSLDANSKFQFKGSATLISAHHAVTALHVIADKSLPRNAFKANSELWLKDSRTDNASAFSVKTCDIGNDLAMIRLLSPRPEIGPPIPETDIADSLPTEAKIFAFSSKDGNDHFSGKVSGGEANFFKFALSEEKSIEPGYSGTGVWEDSAAGRKRLAGVIQQNHRGKGDVIDGRTLKAFLKNAGFFVHQEPLSQMAPPSNEWDDENAGAFLTRQPSCALNVALCAALFLGVLFSLYAQRELSGLRRATASKTALSELGDKISSLRRTTASKTALSELGDKIDGNGGILERLAEVASRVENLRASLKTVTENQQRVEDLALEQARIKELAREQAKLVAEAGRQIPVGAIVAWPTALETLGLNGRWLPCDGSTFDKEKYPELFEAIGMRFPLLDDKGEPKLPCVPDLRGLFLRGADLGSGRDPASGKREALRKGWAAGNDVGSYQKDSVAKHSHEFSGHYTTGAGGQGGTSGFLKDPHKRTGHPFGSEETRPKNFSVVWLIKAANTTNRE